MFIFYFVYTKHQVLLICDENKSNLCCQFDDTIEVYFLLGINIWGLRSEWVNALLSLSRRFEIISSCYLS